MSENHISSYLTPSAYDKIICLLPFHLPTVIECGVVVNDLKTYRGARINLNISRFAPPIFVTFLKVNLINIQIVTAELLYLVSFVMKKFPLSITIVPFLQGLHPVCQLR